MQTHLFVGATAWDMFTFLGFASKGEGNAGGTLGKRGTLSFPASLFLTSHPPHHCPPPASMHTELAWGSSPVGAHPGVCVSPLASSHELPGNGNSWQREEAPEKQFHFWMVIPQA